MKKSAKKRLAAVGMAAALIISAVSVPDQASAAKAVKKVTVNKKKVTLYAGADMNYGSIKIKAKVNPKGAKAKLKWKSNKKKIASVTSKGLIKAKRAGKAVITVKAGKKSAKVKVTVKKIKKKVSQVTVANSSLTLDKNQTATIKAGVAPSKATLKKLTYSSANPKIASVTAKGVVKGLQAGSTTITVRAVDGSKKQAKVAVRVVDPSQSGTVVNPTVIPSQAPVNPTEVPTTNPTEAPSEAPTAAPTEAPTAAPTEAPTAAPTTAPTTAPTEVPTAEPIATADSKIPGNTKYTLDAESSYDTEATVQGEKYQTTLNDATFDLMTKSLAKAVKGLDADYDAYVEKVITEKVYQVADGVTVTLSKEANSSDATVKIRGIGTKVDGDYQLRLSKWWGAEASGGWNSGFNLVLTNWDSNGEVNKIDVNITENLKDAEGTKTYTITGLSVKFGDTQKVYADSEDETDNIDVMVCYSETTKAGSVTIIRGNAKIEASCDGKGGYTISVPDTYLDKYGIKIVAGQ